MILRIRTIVRKLVRIYICAAKILIQKRVGIVEFYTFGKN